MESESARNQQKTRCNVVVAGFLGWGLYVNVLYTIYSKESFYLLDNTLNKVVVTWHALTFCIVD